MSTHTPKISSDDNGQESHLVISNIQADPGEVPSSNTSSIPYDEPNQLEFNVTSVSEENYPGDQAASAALMNIEQHNATEKQEGDQTLGLGATQSNEGFQQLSSVSYPASAAEPGTSGTAGIPQSEPWPKPFNAYLSRGRPYSPPSVPDEKTPWQPPSSAGFPMYTQTPSADSGQPYAPSSIPVEQTTLPLPAGFPTYTQTPPTKPWQTYTGYEPAQPIRPSFYAETPTKPWLDYTAINDMRPFWSPAIPGPYGMNRHTSMANPPRDNIRGGLNASQSQTPHVEKVDEVYVANDPFRPSISQKVNRAHGAPLRNVTMDDVEVPQRPSFNDRTYYPTSGAAPTGYPAWAESVPQSPDSSRDQLPTSPLYQNGTPYRSPTPPFELTPHHSTETLFMSNAPPYDIQAHHENDSTIMLKEDLLIDSKNAHPTLDYVVTFLSITLPSQVYLHLHLRLPSLYFSRVSRIFEDARLSLPEIKKMALETTYIKGNASAHPMFNAFEPPVLPPAYENLKANWEFFIDSVMREWKISNVISVLLLSAILTVLQINGAASDPIARYSALASLICALISLLYGGMYIVRFGTMRKTTKAAEWALEAQKVEAKIWWNVWVMLAMPSIWLTWSILLYIICIMSFVWRSGPEEDQPVFSLSPGAKLGVQILISSLLALGILYGVMIITTFKSYGEVMDNAWQERIKKWLEEKPSPQPSRRIERLSKPILMTERPSNWSPMLFPKNLSSESLHSWPSPSLRTNPPWLEPVSKHRVIFPVETQGSIPFIPDMSLESREDIKPPTHESTVLESPSDLEKPLPDTPLSQLSEPLHSIQPTSDYSIPSATKPMSNPLKESFVDVNLSDLERSLTFIPPSPPLFTIQPAVENLSPGDSLNSPALMSDSTAADVIDRMHSFAEGDSYGPVLDPLLVHAVQADITINPLLQPLLIDEEDRAYLSWNMLFPSSFVLLSTDPPDISWMAGRNQPATFPRVSSLKLVSETYPWPVNVQAQNANVGVTCGEVIDFLSISVNKPCKQKEYGGLSGAHRQNLLNAYFRNRSGKYEVPRGEISAEVKRLDFLLDHTMFGGIENNPQILKSIYGTNEAPACTFILKCRSKNATELAYNGEGSVGVLSNSRNDRGVNHVRFAFQNEYIEYV